MRKWKKILLLAAAISGFTGMTAYAESYWWVNAIQQWGYSADGSNLRDGWYWIDGNRDGVAECYYFQVAVILTDTVTPDGYQVNVDGAWTVDGVVQTRFSGEISGVYTSNYAYNFGKAIPDTPMDWIPLAKDGQAFEKSMGRAGQRGWVEDQGWHYIRENGAYVYGDWAWIGHRCYCFDENGFLYMDTVTPDGYQVNAEGQWVVDGVLQTDLQDTGAGK